LVPGVGLAPPFNPFGSADFKDDFIQIAGLRKNSHNTVQHTVNKIDT
jgi:hypothetical protein